MAKGKWREASKDDPIFSENFTVSSHRVKGLEKKEGGLGKELQKILELASEEHLRELGFLDRDQFIYSFSPESPKKKSKG